MFLYFLASRSYFYSVKSTQFYLPYIYIFKLVFVHDKLHLIHYSLIFRIVQYCLRYMNHTRIATCTNFKYYTERACHRCFSIMDMSVTQLRMTGGVNK